MNDRGDQNALNILVQEINSQHKGIVRVKHSHDMIYCMGKNPTITFKNISKDNYLCKKAEIDGELKTIKNIFHDISSEHIQDNRLINCFFKEFALLGDTSFTKFTNDYISFCTFKNKLIKSNNNATLEETFELISKIPKETIDIFEEIRLLVAELNEAKSRRNQMNLMMRHVPSKKKKHDKDEKRAENKERRTEIYQKLNELNEIINQIKKDIFPIRIDDNLLSSLCEINTPKELLFMPGIKPFDSFFQIFVPLNKCDECLQILQRTTRGLSIEIVPICSVIIFHSKESKITAESFNSRISDICERFGAIVSKKKTYQAYENSFAKGSIEVQLLTKDFLFPFVNEINDIFNSNL